MWPLHVWERLLFSELEGDEGHLREIRLRGLAKMEVIARSGYTGKGSVETVLDWLNSLFQFASWCGPEELPVKTFHGCDEDSVCKLVMCFHRNPLRPLSSGPTIKHCFGEYQERIKEPYRDVLLSMLPPDDLPTSAKREVYGLMWEYIDAI